MSANALTVARNDLLDVRRSKLVLFVCGLYTLFATLLIYLGSTNDPTPPVSAQLYELTGLGVLLVPLIALVSSYLAVAGERESGTVRFRLGLPNSRFDVVLGKFVSRATLVSAAFVVSMIVAVGVAAALYPSPDFADVPAFVGVTVLFLVAYVAIAVGISAATGSRSRAMGAAIAYFFVFNVLWILNSFSVVSALRFAFEDTLGLSLHQHFYAAVRLLSPVAAYLQSTLLFLSPADGPNVPPEPTGVPVYLTPEFAPVVLLGWIAAPLAVGYWRFRTADLG